MHAERDAALRASAVSLDDDDDDDAAEPASVSAPELGDEAESEDEAIGGGAAVSAESLSPFSMSQD